MQWQQRRCWKLLWWSWEKTIIQRVLGWGGNGRTTKLAPSRHFPTQFCETFSQVIFKIYLKKWIINQGISIYINRGCPLSGFCRRAMGIFHQTYFWQHSTFVAEGEMEEPPTRKLWCLVTSCDVHAKLKLVKCRIAQNMNVHILGNAMSSYFYS